MGRGLSDRDMAQHVPKYILPLASNQAGRGLFDLQKEEGNGDDRVTEVARRINRHGV